MDNLSNLLIDKLIDMTEESLVTLERAKERLKKRQGNGPKDPFVELVTSVSKDGTRLQAIVRRGNNRYTRHLRQNINGDWVGRTLNSEVPKKMGQKLQETGRAGISTQLYVVRQELIKGAYRRQV